MCVVNDRITFNTTAAKHATLVMQLDIARTAGYEAIEITQDKVIDYLNAGFSESELLAELAGFVIHGIGAVVDIERQGTDTERLLHEADELFQVAARIGARGVQVVTGPLNVQAVVDFRDNRQSTRYAGLLGHHEEEQIRLTAQNLRSIADRATEYGLVVYLEALSWGPLHSVDQQIEVLRRADRDNLKIVIDYWHCYTSGVTPDEVARIDADLIYGVHVCDSLPFAGGIPLEPILRNVTTGSGVLNLKEWTDAVKSTGYQGWWCSETFCKRQQQGDSYAIAKALKRQLESLVNDGTPHHLDIPCAPDE